MASQSGGMELDPTIRGYYEQRPEEERLLHGPSRLEAVRTRSLIERHAPALPATIIDVGGAAGAYALWLASRGYRVHLIDPIERLVEVARARSMETDQPLESCEVGDARALHFSDDSADAVLLLGPLYHLTSASDRARALSEVHRVLKAGGLVFAAVISRWASTLDALAHDYFKLPGRAAVIARAMGDGQHRNTDGAGGFTTSYFHRPEEIREELEEAKFKLVELYAIEGFAGFLPDFEERWADPRQRAEILRIAEALEREDHLLGATPHLLAVGRK